MLLLNGGRCRFMKKVRALGLVGLAPTAIGFAFPAANAMATATHSPRNGAKTVSLWQRERAQAPLVNCGYGHANDATSTHGYLRGQISYSHRCIAAQEAYLNRRQAGLTERIRYYSYNGTRVHSAWRPGTIENFSTYFLSFGNIYAYLVCEALVANSNHNNVKYGPVCERATS
jgi:hypothetical protein